MLQICASGQSSNEFGIDPDLRDKRSHHSVTCVDICGHDNATNTKLTAERKKYVCFILQKKKVKAPAGLFMSPLTHWPLSSSEEGMSAWMLLPQAVMGACRNQLSLQNNQEANQTLADLIT